LKKEDTGERNKWRRRIRADISRGGRDKCKPEKDFELNLSYLFSTSFLFLAKETRDSLVVGAAVHPSMENESNSQQIMKKRNKYCWEVWFQSVAVLEFFV